MKKITRIVLPVLLLGIMIMIGYILGERDQAIVAFSNDTTEYTDQAAGSTQLANSTQPDEMSGNQYQIDGTDIGTLLADILDHCSREFIGGYPVDETFLLWIYSKYGSDAINSIDEQIANGQENESFWRELTGDSIHVLWLKYCDDTGYGKIQLNRVYWKNCASENDIVLDFTGDINFADGMGTMKFLDQADNGLRDCLSEELLAEMNQADILTVNNEFTYSTRGEPLKGKDYTFRADPSRVKLLDEMGVDLANLANNHVCDYGEDALLDTLSTLTDDGIPYVGAGENLTEAMQPAYFVANGYKIAIVSATQIERSLNYTKEATDTTPGVLKTLDPEKFVSEIELARKYSDYVIVFVHWGTEGNNRYGADQMELARQFVQAGADTIIGGHTHCLQGISYVEDVPVIYSLGNFWFSSTGSDGNKKKDTGIAQIVIGENGLKFRFIPCVQENYRTNLVTDQNEKERIINYMLTISDGVSINEDGYVTNLKE